MHVIAHHTVLLNMDAPLRFPVSPHRARPQTASAPRLTHSTKQPLLSFPGRPQSASTKQPAASEPQSPGSVWLRLFRPNSKAKDSIHFVSSHAGSSVLSSSSPSRPNSTSPMGGVSPAALAKALRKRIHPQVTLNGYSLVKAFSKIRTYEASPPITPKATDWSEQELTCIANAKSLETFLRLMTGKREKPMQRKKPSVPVWTRPTVRRKQEFCTLLDGRD